MRQHQPRILSSPALPSAEHRSATAIGHAPIVASWAEHLTAIGLTPPPSDAAVALWGGREGAPIIPPLRRYSLVRALWNR